MFCNENSKYSNSKFAANFLKEWLKAAINSESKRVRRKERCPEISSRFQNIPSICSYVHGNY